MRTMRRINATGYAAYLVGGAVRDRLLGRRCYDYDIATNAPLSLIKKRFKTYNLGEKFGTIGIIESGQLIDVTRFRTENSYTDARHPDQVIFTDTIESDLSRRDFTINAIAYSADNHSIDPFNGLADLKHKRILAVGDAMTRFREDSLRLLRAYRLSAQLGFACDLPDSVQWHRLPAWERITNEFNRLIHAPYAALALETMQANHHLDYLFPNASWPKNWVSLTQQPTVFKWPFFIACTQSDHFRLPRKTMRWVRHVISYNFNWRRCLLRPCDLALSAYDLMVLGCQGPDIKQVQLKLLDYIATNPNQNTKIALTQYLQQ